MASKWFAWKLTCPARRFQAARRSFQSLRLQYRFLIAKLAEDIDTEKAHSFRSHDVIRLVKYAAYFLKYALAQQLHIYLLTSADRCHTDISLLASSYVLLKNDIFIFTLAHHDTFTHTCAHISIMTRASIYLVVFHIFSSILQILAGYSTIFDFQIDWYRTSHSRFMDFSCNIRLNDAHEASKLLTISYTFLRRTMYIFLFSGCTFEEYILLIYYFCMIYIFSSLSGQQYMVTQGRISASYFVTS